VKAASNVGSGFDLSVLTCRSTINQSSMGRHERMYLLNMLVVLLWIIGYCNRVTRMFLSVTCNVKVVRWCVAVDEV